MYTNCMSMCLTNNNPLSHIYSHTHALGRKQLFKNSRLTPSYFHMWSYTGTLNSNLCEGEAGNNDDLLMYRIDFKHFKSLVMVRNPLLMEMPFLGVCDDSPATWHPSQSAWEQNNNWVLNNLLVPEVASVIFTIYPTLFWIHMHWFSPLSQMD